ncbi:DUF5103 domain-containing protein [Massilibacteroides sp.]|uniref:type IX secretion system plug protein n=1 Tax=Massilibacteroides sp. TaxID=2034766 RepID=UPI002622AAA2|nr:DUF5103 domain-containing protein [Massilibacteroides sp.]MDD4514106.1 DUF5103 domain-containing protein [Massilibacteroides sp.]
MKLVFFFFVFCMIGGGSLTAQTRFNTSVSSPLIHSLQLHAGDELISDPMIELGGNEQLEINFDVIGDNYSRYLYSIIHCNADWTPSGLVSTEYMTGFQQMEIEDFANSLATTTAYTNYRFFLPNEDVTFKLSGNYAVQVFDEADRSKVLFTACFFVTESVVPVDAEVTGITDIDVNKHHQQLSFVIRNKNFQIPHPVTDLKLFVYQNGRRDNAVTGLKPSAISQNELLYSHTPELIFKAGNEYRRMEFLSNKYNGMNVQNIQFHNPYYHVTLYPDQIRNQGSYQYDQDQNGRFFVQCSNCEDPDVEADYHIVHFSLEADEIPAGKVYLDGLFMNNQFNESSRMEYNSERKQYEKSLLLKQGNYNYQYLFVPDGETKGQTFPIEGDFAETENEYLILVYYRPIGARYDRLIGFSKIN